MDDQALVAIEIEDILVARGFEVVSVSTRKNLDLALQNGRYAVIVTDTDLVTFDEIQGWPSEQIIICSGKQLSTLQDEFPGIAIVPKPFETKHFLDLLPTI